MTTFSERIQTCTKCPELAATRKNAVVGEGPVPSNLVFLGEAPGADEDRTGRPFVGTSGRILRTYLLKLGVDPKDVYILNCLKCRPPGNRSPKDEELEACRPYLFRQLKRLNPNVIVAMGRYAQSYILGVHPDNIRVGNNAGKVVPYLTARAVLTYHPAFVQRSGMLVPFIRHLRKAITLAKQLDKKSMEV